jgi:hypothetical protein
MRYSPLSCRKLHSNFLVNSHNAPDDDDRHYPALAFDGTVIRSSQYLAEQSWFEPIDLLAWISKSGHSHHGVVADTEYGAFGQGE